MSIVTKIYNQKGEEAGEVKLSDKVFAVEANEALVHQAMVTQMSNERQVIAHTKDRSEVRGGGRKPWRQKGTGRARAGSTRSPIWIGGGVTFGPRNERNFKKKINKKMKQKALLMVLSDKVNNKGLAILDKLEVGEYKTKPMDELVGMIETKILKIKPVEKSTSAKALVDKKGKAKKEKVSETKTSTKKDIKRSALIVVDKKDEKTKYSFRNLSGIKFVNIDNINILDLLKYRDLILTKNTVKLLEERYGK